MTTALKGDCSRSEGYLYVALELGAREWKLAFAPGVGLAPRLVTIERPWKLAWEAAVKAAKRRFHLPATATIRSCYEAGRDGFWIHRWLESMGVENVVIDSSSIEVNRRQRRAKSDRLDAQKLLGMLLRFDQGETSVWRTVHVPTAAQEFARHPHREVLDLKRERTRHINRIKSHLATVGVRLPLRSDFQEIVPKVRQWDGSPLPGDLQRRLLREYHRIALLDAQMTEIEDQILRRLSQDRTESGAMVRRLAGLRGIGIGSAWILVHEIFGWRAIRNRRELGALVGLTPTPYASGNSRREQGISKAGNARVRWLMVELARLWRRYQPESLLVKEYTRRFAFGNARNRKVGIVALARKLLIALWRRAVDRKVPQGAIVVNWQSKSGHSHKLTSTCREAASVSPADPPRIRTLA